MKYVFDIDNTICRTEGSDYLNSKPILDRIVTVNTLFEQGHHIIYYTARGAKSKMDWYAFTKKQLESWGAKHHVLLCNKLDYDIWVDDKAMSSEVYFSIN